MRDTFGWLTVAAVILAAAPPLIWTFAPKDALAPDPTLAERAIDLGDLRLAMDLPPEAKIGSTATGDILIDLRPGVRQPAQIRLRRTVRASPSARSENAHDPDWESARSRQDGGPIRYRLLDHDGPVGSGGEEIRLIGETLIADARIDVDCRMQREGATRRSGAWCLTYLATLRALNPATVR